MELRLWWDWENWKFQERSLNTYRLSRSMYVHVRACVCECCWRWEPQLRARQTSTLPLMYTSKLAFLPPPSLKKVFPCSPGCTILASANQIRCYHTSRHPWSLPTKRKTQKSLRPDTRESEFWNNLWSLLCPFPCMEDSLDSSMSLFILEIGLRPNSRRLSLAASLVEQSPAVDS